MINSPEFKFNKPEEIISEPEYLSQEGFEKLQKKLEDLKARRQEIARLLEETKADGDLTENSGYVDAKERWGENEDEIVELEDILSRAMLIPKEKRGDIQIGSSVVIKRDGGRAPDKYFLVGAAEADPLRGKISNESPLGAKLVGRKKGEKVEVLTPNGKIAYTIIDVE